jgi:ribonuclease D
MTELTISSAEELAAFCRELAGCPVFGFDTEFIGEQTFVPDLCLLQVAMPDRLIVIDPLSVGPLDGFWNLVADPAHVTVVHSGREEIRMCKRGCGRPPGNVFDLQIAAGLAGYGYPLGAGPLIHQATGERLPKGETLTDWRKRPLSPKQVQYAFDDVRYLLRIWQILAEKLERLRRREWAIEEFAALVRRSLEEEPGVERWRKVGGLGGLDRKKLAVVRDLYYWREERASRQNRPARTVVRDDLLVEIARRSPKEEHDLEVMRGVQKKEIPEILRVVREARALPPDQYPTAVPRDNDPSQVALVTGLLNAVLGDFCARTELAPGLVCNTADVRQLVRCERLGQRLPDANPLAGGWRAEFVLPELKAMLEGHRSIRIASLNRDAPFAVESVGSVPANARP